MQVGERGESACECSRHQEPMPSQVFSTSGVGCGSFDEGDSCVCGHSTDILTEDVDQAILHFTVAVRDREKATIIRAALFTNAALTRAAWPDQTEQLNNAEDGHRSAGLLPSRPSLWQWVDVLESLTNAALPTAFKYVRELYENATTWTSVDRTCALAVMNLIFITLVLYQQAKRSVHVLKRQLRCRPPGPHHRRAVSFEQRFSSSPEALTSSGRSFPSRSAPLVPTVSPPTITADQHALECLLQRLEHLYDAQQAICIRYARFVAWNAETQLREVKVHASVLIKGVPQLTQLPRSPLYLSEHDGWIWVWIMMVLYSTLHQPPSEKSDVRDGHSSGARLPNASRLSSGEAIVTSSSVPALFPMMGASAPNSRTNTEKDATDNPLYTATGRHLHCLLGATEAVGDRASASRAQGAHSNERPVEEASLAAADVAVTLPREGTRTLYTCSATTHLLRNMYVQPGGEVFAQRIVYTTLISFDVFLRLWVTGKPVVGEILRSWALRTVCYPRNTDVAAPSRMHALRELIVSGSLEEPTRVVVNLDELVVHASHIFVVNAKLLLQLHQLVEQLVPLQLTLLYLSALHPSLKVAVTEDDVDDGDSEVGIGEEFCTTEKAQQRQLNSRQAPRHLCCETTISQPRHYCTAVFQLVAHIAELLLEPQALHTAVGGAAHLPQSLCVTMLKTATMFLASDFLSDGAGPGSLSAAPGGSPVSLRRQWRCWSTWTNAAQGVCLSENRSCFREFPTDATLARHRKSCSTFFVQAFSLALEHLYSLLHALTSTAPPSESFASPTISLTFHQIGVFCSRLYGDHQTITTATAKLHAVKPFVALGEESLNALTQVLQHYAALVEGSSSVSKITCTSAVPPHRSLWLLAVAYLRLAAIDSAVTTVQAAADQKTRLKGFHASSQGGWTSRHSFTCALPQVSMFCLRDRSFESSEDWVQQQQPRWSHKSLLLRKYGAEVPALLQDVVQLFCCYRGEMQRDEDAISELLLLASVRLLTAALYCTGSNQARENTEPASRTRVCPRTVGSPYAPSSVERQASVYATAFSRYLCMQKKLSSRVLVFLLRSIREELHKCDGRHLVLASSTAAAAAMANTPWFGDLELHDARAFQLETGLYFV